MEILNKVAIINGNSCYYVSSDSKIIDVNMEYVRHLSHTYDELRKSEKSSVSVEELNNASELVKKNTKYLRRVRTKDELERQGGFILVSSITTLGVLAVGSIIFMAIKQIIVG